MCVPVDATYAIDMLRTYDTTRSDFYLFKSIQIDSALFFFFFPFFRAPVILGYSVM